jgi:hypothetical protein
MMATGETNWGSAVAGGGFFLESITDVVDDIFLRRWQYIDVTCARVLGQLNRLVEGAELALKVPGEVSRDRVVIQTSPAPPGPAAHPLLSREGGSSPAIPRNVATDHRRVNPPRSQFRMR